jgi:hypothetical protein
LITREKVRPRERERAREREREREREMRTNKINNDSGKFQTGAVTETRAERNKGKSNQQMSA